MVLLRSASRCPVLLCFLRYCTVRLKMFSLFLHLFSMYYLCENYYKSITVSACSVAKSCPTLCDLMNCSPPGPSVHGILQARTLEWVAITYSRIFLTQGSNLHLLLAGRFFATSTTWEGQVPKFTFAKYTPNSNYFMAVIHMHLLICENKCANSWCNPS